MKTISYKQQQGFTLIEIMVAAVISLIILGGVAQVFLGNRDSYRLLQASSNVQETGRFGMEFLVKDIRMAGYMGCASANNVNLTNNVDVTKTSDDVDNSVANFDGTNSIIGYTYDTTFPTDLGNFDLTSSDVVQGTDVVFIQRASSCPGGDILDHNQTSAQYKIADNSQCQIQQNDVVLLSDCANADIHGVTNSPGSTGTVNIAHAANLNKTPKLNNTYGPGSSMYKMTAMVYYIGFNPDNEPALFRRRLVGDSFVTEELVEGVYDMDILYGVDTNGDGVSNRYVSETDVGNWEGVVTVNTTLFTRSMQDGVTEQPITYNYNGASLTDNRLQRDFRFTTTIRNRVQ
ncbi:PilW family protein [Thiohalophilus sp.]|uniref:PilW family protein n=1 Tax=Thiohalophilus sp. TaxID=3028392 RepID=UPI002ACE2DC2|nr:PilW family protein [Thiohalophilus sp.]MDZ7803056.1 PilW family protein [Thiohalophilus sp.]